jgi:hypothetical protein
MNGSLIFTPGAVSTWNVDLRNDLTSDLLDLSGGTGNLVFGLTAASSINLNLMVLDSLDEGVKSYIIATKSAGAFFAGI